MEAPRYIQKELALINPMYFAVLNPCIREGTNMSYGRNRWQVRKWTGTYPKSMRLWDTQFSEPILTICKEEYSQELGLYDAGYKEIDMRDIDAIRQSHWWKLRWKKNIQELDWRNEKRQRQAKDQLEYESKYAAKKIWRHLHEPTVHQSGKWDYYKG